MATKQRSIFNEQEEDLIPPGHNVRALKALKRLGVDLVYRGGDKRNGLTGIDTEISRFGHGQLNWPAWRLRGHRAP